MAKKTKSTSSQSHQCINTPMQDGFANPLKKGNTSTGGKKGK